MTTICVHLIWRYSRDSPNCQTKTTAKYTTYTVCMYGYCIMCLYIRCPGMCSQWLAPTTTQIKQLPLQTHWLIIKYQYEQKCLVLPAAFRKTWCLQGIISIVWADKLKITSLEVLCNHHSYQLGTSLDVHLVDNFHRSNFSWFGKLRQFCGLIFL